MVCRLKILIIILTLSAAACSNGKSKGRGQSGQKTPAQNQSPIAIEDQQTQTKPDANLPSSADQSLGTGGATGAIEIAFSASNGKKSTYKTEIPADIGPEKSYGVNIHLHGDRGGDYNWLYKPNVRVAAKHGLIGIVIKAPNSQLVWYENGRDNALFLHEFLQNELYKKYNINKKKIYFSGVSGGSQFLTGIFLPLYGEHYTGGALMMCGGPKNWLGSFNPSDSFKSQFKLYWYTHTGDFLYDQVENGIDYYTSKGFDVKSEILSGGSHCDFNEGIPGALDAKLPLILHD